MKVKKTDEQKGIFKLQRKQKKKNPKEKILKKNVQLNTDNSKGEYTFISGKTKKVRGRLGIELLCMSVIPILLIGVVTCVITWKTFTSNSKNQIEQDLITAATSVKSSYEHDVGEYSYAAKADGSRGDLWKGSYNISKSFQVLNIIKKKTGIDITVMNKEEIVVTTAVNEKSGEQKKLEISTDIIDKVNISCL